MLIQILIDSQQLDSKMSLIPDLCKLVCRGERISSENENALRLFMNLPDNLLDILQAAWKEPSLLICYKAYTLSQRRTKQYFKYLNVDSTQFLEHALANMCGAPLFISQHQSNIYLSLEGQLLALFIQQQGRNGFIQEYLSIVQELEAPMEIKVHFVLKIITSCLQQLKQIFNKHTAKIKFKSKAINFITQYAPIINPHLDLMTDIIANNFDKFHDPYHSISNLLEAHDSFLRVMGQQQDFEASSGAQFNQTKVYIMKWQENSFIKWAQFYCNIVVKIFRLFQSEYKAMKQEDVPKIDRVACRCLHLVTHVYFLTMQNLSNFVQSQLGKSVQQIIINRLLIPFFDNLSNEDRSQYSLRYLSSQFHSAFLILLTKDRSLLFNYFELFYPYNKQKPKQSPHLVLIHKYCKDVIHYYYFYFTNFQMCPIGLSLKLFCLATSITVQIFSNSTQSNISLKKFSEELDEMYKEFFEKFLLNKMMNNFHMSEQNQLLYSEGKDWQQFITQSLNYYFQDLATLMPDYDTYNNDSSDYRFIRKANQRNKRIFEGKTIQNNYENFQQYKKDQRFIIFTKILSQISFKKLNNSSQKIEEQNPLEEQDSVNELDQNEDLKEQITFANMMPLLACFLAMVKKVSNVELRAQLFYDFYLIELDIKIINYYVCSSKARICKLYILQTFFQEILPDRFVEDGEKASDTLVFLIGQIGQSLDQLVMEATDVISECIAILDEDDEDHFAIVQYAVGILEKISSIMCLRVLQLAQRKQYYSLKSIQTYSTRLQLIFESVKLFQTKSPKAYRKLFTISGYFIDLCGPTCLYNIYQKLKSETLQNNKMTVENKDKFIQLYFSGITGILAGIPRCELFRNAAQMILIDIKQYRHDHVIQLQESLLEIYLSFMDTLMCSKLYDVQQDSIGLLVHDILDEDLSQITEWSHKSQYENICINLYRKLAKTNDVFQLHPLPHYINMENFPEVLDCYFQQLTRLPNLSQIQKYAGITIQWMINFLQAKVERMQVYQPNISQLAINFRFKRREKLLKLASLVAMATTMPKSEVLKKFDIQGQEIDNVYYFLHVDNKEDVTELLNTIAKK